MTNLDRTEYIRIRDEIAKAIATAKYPYNALGIIIDGQTISRNEFWNMQGESFKESKLIEAQAAMSVMAEIGYNNVIVSAFEDYVSEK